MRRIIIFVILVLITTTYSLSQTINIQGVVADSVSSEILPYSNIIIKNSQDSVVAGTITEKNGSFQIKILFEEGMKLNASCIGYSEKEIILPGQFDSKNIKLDKILLTPKSTLLGETEIVSNQKYMVQKFDRKVYNISQARVSAASTILDILRTLPGVSVDEQGNVKYKGAAAEIYIDDMPSKYIYPDIEMIPVANIAKIELIDASMRSSGSGVGGIINIKMKVAVADGLSGMQRLGSNSFEFDELDRYSGFTNINYKLGKLLLFSNSHFNKYNSFVEKGYEGNVDYGSYNYNVSERELWNTVNNSYSGNLGFDYKISEKTRLIFACGFWSYKTNTSLDSTSFEYTDPITDSIVNRYGTSTISDYDMASAWVYLYLQHKPDTTDKEFHGSYSLYPPEIAHTSNDLTKYYTEYQNYQSINAINTYEKTFRQKRIHNVANLYYNHPLSENARWNVGYDGEYVILYDRLSEYFIDDQINYPNNSNHTGIIQNNSVFFRIGSRYKKWMFDAGLNFKNDNYNLDHKRYTADSKDTLININKSYYFLLPSTTIDFSIDSLNKLKLTYSRSAQAPSDNQLLDFMDKRNPLYWFIGNPDLKAVTYDNIYLGYSLNKEKWNLSTEVFCSMTDNDISELLYPYNEAVFIQTFDNIAFQSQLGVELSGFFSIKSKYDFTIESSIYHSYIDATSLENSIFELGYPGDNLIKRNYGAKFKLVSNLRFNSKNSMTLYFDYTSRQYTVEGYNNAHLGTYFSYTYKMMKNRLIASFGVANLFNNLTDRGAYGNMLGLKYNEELYDAHYVKPYYFIYLSYRFRQGDRNTSKVNG